MGGAQLYGGGGRGALGLRLGVGVGVPRQRLRTHLVQLRRRRGWIRVWARWNGDRDVESEGVRGEGIHPDYPVMGHSPPEYIAIMMGPDIIMIDARSCP